MGETAGTCLQAEVDLAVSMDHVDVLRHYVNEIGPQKIVDAVEDCVQGGSFSDLKPVMDDEGEDPQNVLGLLRNLIRSRFDDVWVCVEDKLPISLEKFLGDDGGDLYFALKERIETELDINPAMFLRADANGDGRIDVSDPVFTVRFLFTGGPEPGCRDAADSNNDGNLDISDVQYALSFLFLGRTAPPAPGPSECGTDVPSGESDDDGLDCKVYTGCIVSS